MRSSRPAPSMGMNFEYIMWVFTRLSGMGLFLLAAIGIVGAFWMGARTQMDVGAVLRWTFFPNPFHVVNTEIPDVTIGWASAYWQVLQMLIVFLGVTHGINGIRMVLEDYLERPGSRTLLRGLLFLVWVFITLVAIYVILAS